VASRYDPLPKAVEIALRNYSAARQMRRNICPNMNARDMVSRDADEREAALSLAGACNMHRESLRPATEFATELARYADEKDPVVRLARAVVVADRAMFAFGPQIGI